MISSCADGFAMNGHHCSNGMFPDEGPYGWFTSLCPATCGTCMPCADEDEVVMMVSQNAILSCAFGFTISGYVCSDEMFVDSFGAPTGWFKSACPDTCGMCPDDGSSDDHADNPCEHLCSLAACFSYEAMARPECADCCSCLNHWNPCPFSASSCGDGVCDLKEGEGYTGWAECYEDCHCGDGFCDRRLGPGVGLGGGLGAWAGAWVGAGA